MDDPRMLTPHTNDDECAPPRAGSAATWLAQEPTGPTLDSESEAALLIRLSAQKLWAEGRANPVWFECRSWIGDWQTDDRVTWRTTDGIWLGQLQRSSNGRRVFLRLWRGQTFVGHQDDGGWHPAAARSRSRHPRAVQRALPLPLAG